MGIPRPDRKLLLFRIFMPWKSLQFEREPHDSCNGKDYERWWKYRVAFLALEALAGKKLEELFTLASLFVVERASIKCCFCFLSGLVLSWCRSNRSKAGKLFFRENFRRKLFLFTRLYIALGTIQGSRAFKFKFSWTLRRSNRFIIILHCEIKL